MFFIEGNPRPDLCSRHTKRADDPVTIISCEVVIHDFKALFEGYFGFDISGTIPFYHPTKWVQYMVNEN